MKITKIKTAVSHSAQPDLEHFSKELRELSDRHGVKLVSVGAMAMADAGTNGGMYLAIWSSEPSAITG